MQGPPVPSCWALDSQDALCPRSPLAPLLTQTSLSHQLSRTSGGHLRLHNESSKAKSNPSTTDTGSAVHSFQFFRIQSLDIGSKSNTESVKTTSGVLLSPKKRKPSSLWVLEGVRGRAAPRLCLHPAARPLWEFILTHHETKLSLKNSANLWASRVVGSFFAVP